jgi:hypothetical protein
MDPAYAWALGDKIEFLIWLLVTTIPVAVILLFDDSWKQP